ncbi:DUF1737 domain-containing protein [Chryseobacterium cucumeris]|uniref:DUF1737 domain-containing protein n=1 Tax=Chryseobacterium cucumeris TaxID=1813611 RepID=UPI00320A580B
MKEYQIITHQAPPEFAKLVNQALKEGWQLIGGISTTAVPKDENTYQIFFSQALAK